MKRILITGGAGFLGSHLVRLCLQNPEAQITVLDSLEFAATQLPANLRPYWDRIEYVRGSICNSKLLKELIPYQNAILHCAAQTSHILSIQDPRADAEVNAEGTLKILETMRHFNREAVLVYPSTTSVTGKPIYDPVDESHPFYPLDIYSIHKVLSERYCFSYNKFHKIRMSILRFGNLFGPNGKEDPEYNFINYFIHRARKNESITVFGKGDQIRNVTYVEDAARLMLMAMTETGLHDKHWFATSPYYHSVREIAEEIIKVFESGSLEFQDWPEQRREIEVGTVHFSSAALLENIQSYPFTPLHEGLQKTKAAFQKSHLDPKK